MFKRAYVEITNRCNLNCAFCPGTRRPVREMTVEEFQVIADRLRPFTGYLYFHVMGEPLLHSRLADFFSVAAERNFRVCITTNGTLLRERGDLLCNASALYKLSVSLHSFEGNGGTEMGSYLDSVWRACLPLADRGVICVLRLWNEGGLEERNREIETFLEERTGQSRDQWPAVRPNVRKLGENLFLERASKFDWPDRKADERHTEFCYGLRTQIAVLCDGTVVPCCLDHEGDIPLGNLLNGELEEILRSPRGQALYEGFSRRCPTEELCRRCGYAVRFNGKS